MSRKAKLRLLLLLIMAGVGGYLGYVILAGRDPLPPYLAAQQHYDAGLAREKAGDFQAAAREYDQASALLDQAHRRLTGPHGFEEASAKDIAGKVLSLKVKALRDRSYARAAAAGTPLPLAIDTASGEQFRNVLAIRDVKDRDEAVASLRAATQFATGDPEVQFEGVRLALMSAPIDWAHVERLSKAILAVRPDDTRAKYHLAKIDFEQPDLTTNLPTPPAKRSRERVRSAGRLIEEVRTDPEFPVWRTEFLRAGVSHWLAKYSQIVREKRASAEVLDQMLFDPGPGVLTRLRKRQHMDRLGVWDSEGILGLYAIASEVALAKTRRDKADPRSDPNNPEHLALVRSVYLDLLTFCDEKTARRDAAFPPSLISATLLTTMIGGQTVLPQQDRSTWQRGLSLLKASMKEEFQADRCDPARVAQLAELLMRESVASQGGDPRQADELRAEAKRWLEDGLALARRRGFSAGQVAPMHLMAANVGFQSGATRADLKPHLDALQHSALPQAVATALLIDGAYDEREGRLPRAQEKIERAVKIKGGEEEIRGHATLASIYMALGRPDYALSSLTYLDKVLDHVDDLTNLEREWWANTIGTPHNYDALVILIHLAHARQSVEEYRASHPEETTYPPMLVKADEDRVKELLGLLGDAGPGFVARTAWARHLAATGRLKEAEDQWLALTTATPGRVELLALKVDLMEREASESGDARKKQSLVADVDRRIVAFLKSNPAHPPARIYQALWLAKTDRADEALAKVDEIDAGPLAPELRRVTMVLRRTLPHVGGSLLTRHLPRSPQVDQVLFDLLRSASAPAAEAKEAFVRHEQVGLERILRAEDLFQAASYARAAELFAATLDFTRLEAYAQQGLLRSLIALADQDPAAAQETAQRIIDEFPTEPAVSLALAYAALVLGEIGDPADDMKSRRSMGAALNAWEYKLTNPLTAPAERAEAAVSIALTKAEFFLRAPRPDVARQQARIALQQKSPAVLAAAALAGYAGILLDDPSRDPRVELAGYQAALEKAASESLAAQRVLGRIAEASRKWDEVVRINEQVISKDPYDHEAASRIVKALEARGTAEQALLWAKAWREKTPYDAEAAAAEIRLLSRMKQAPQAILVADQFLKHAEGLRARRTEAVKDLAVRNRLVEEARGREELELARGFFLGGDLDEAERRLSQPYLDGPAARQLLADVAIQKNDWKKAAAILEAAVVKNPRDLVAAEKLASLLTLHAKDAARARTLLLAAIPPESADRLPAPLLHTIGVVYTALAPAEPQQGRELLKFFGDAGGRFPRDARVELYAGYGRELIGENARAREHYERAIKKLADSELTNDERTALRASATAFRDRVDRKLPNR